MNFPSLALFLGLCQRSKVILLLSDSIHMMKRMRERERRKPSCYRNTRASGIARAFEQDVYDQVHKYLGTNVSVYIAIRVLVSGDGQETGSMYFVYSITTHSLSTRRHARPSVRPSVRPFIRISVCLFLLTTTTSSSSCWACSGSGYGSGVRLV